MAQLGTLEWAEKTHGKLGLRDKFAMIYQGVRARAATKDRMRNNVKFRFMEVDDIVPPDSVVAREAMMMCEEDSAPYLFHHCLRAYYWARLLDDGKRRFDDEALFVAFMLHDMGLTDRHRIRNTTDHCFTMVGAKMTQELGAKHRWSDKRSDLAANAISLHLNVSVAPAHGREAELLRLGSGADVAGLGTDVLHQDQIDAVVTKYPRLNLKTEMAKPLGIEVRERPCCRIAFLHTKLGFGGLIKNSKFEE